MKVVNIYRGFMRDIHTTLKWAKGVFNLYMMIITIDILLYYLFWLFLRWSLMIFRILLVFLYDIIAFKFNKIYWVVCLCPINVLYFEFLFAFGTFFCLFLIVHEYLKLCDGFFAVHEIWDGFPGGFSNLIAFPMY